MIFPMVDGGAISRTELCNEKGSYVFLQTICKCGAFLLLQKYYLFKTCSRRNDIGILRDIYGENSLAMLMDEWEIYNMATSGVYDLVTVVIQAFVEI